MEFTGDVKVDISTSISDTIHTPEANGKGVVFSGNAQVTASSNGNVIRHLGKEPVVIKDKAQVSVVMKGTNLLSRNGLYAKQFRMEGGSLDVSLDATGLPAGIKSDSVYTCRAIFVEGAAGVTLKGDGKGIAGARSYNRSAKGVITVKDGGSGYVEVYGDPAFNIKLKKITTNSSVLKAGADKKSAEDVKEVKGTEAYVFLGSTNPPPTSDLSIAIFVAVALVAVAATVTTVVFRKKYSR